MIWSCDSFQLRCFDCLLLQKSDGVHCVTCKLIHCTRIICSFAAVCGCHHVGNDPNRLAKEEEWMVTWRQLAVAARQALAKDGFRDISNERDDDEDDDDGLGAEIARLARQRDKERAVAAKHTKLLLQQHAWAAGLTGPGNDPAAADEQQPDDLAVADNISGVGMEYAAAVDTLETVIDEDALSKELAAMEAAQREQARRAAEQQKLLRQQQEAR